MTCERDPGAEMHLRQTLGRYPNVCLRLYLCDPERLSDVFVDRHLSKETYLRFLAPSVLPPDVTRVVYLDSDLVVLDDIAALQAVDLKGKAVAAARDFDYHMAETIESRYPTLGIRPGHPYVNAGVLVMDLALWRRERVAERLLAYAARQGAKLALHDQDALNAVLQDEIALLDIRWNVQARYYTRSWIERFGHELPTEARRRPGIVHYATAEKPWTPRVHVHKRALYSRFLRKTRWHHDRPASATALQRVERTAAAALLRLGLDIYLLLPLARRLRARLTGTPRPLPFRARSGGHAGNPQ
jgi:lipopolysaccharide biosynthesis glycosyltransferase